jgi:septal ring factor EnvC (AmiA/AmiB activator)
MADVQGTSSKQSIFYNPAIWLAGGTAVGVVALAVYSNKQNNDYQSKHNELSSIVSKLVMEKNTQDHETKIKDLTTETLNLRTQLRNLEQKMEECMKQLKQLRKIANAAQEKHVTFKEEKPKIEEEDDDPVAREIAEAKKRDMPKKRNPNSLFSIE